jgi:citrate lyase subunit beta / citryl-CoA lyase
VLIRVNALGSAHIAADLRLCAGGPHAIVVPMLRHPDEVRAADRLIGEAESSCGIPPGSTGLVCMLETPRAVLKALDLLEASPRVVGAIFGPNDFIAATGARSIGPHGFEYHADVEVAHALVVAACAAAGVPSLTPVLTRLDDIAALEQEAARAYAHGYHGVIVVDPLQLAALRRASRPQPDAVAFAKGIVNAFETGEAEASRTYDGWFVYEGPFLTMARELLEAAGGDDT